jgi:hypothetical protein
MNVFAVLFDWLFGCKHPWFHQANRYEEVTDLVGPPYTICKVICLDCGKVIERYEV